MKKKGNKKTSQKGRSQNENQAHYYFLFFLLSFIRL